MTEGILALAEVIEQRAVERAAIDRELAESREYLTPHMPALVAALEATREMREARSSPPSTKPSSAIEIAVRVIRRLLEENAILQDRIDALQGVPEMDGCGMPSPIADCGCNPLGVSTALFETITLTPPCGN